MSVAVSYPGVYIQEIPSGVRTITGVSTSIAAFFGRTTMGPINVPVRCLSLSDYVRNFGGPHPESELANAVRLFFENGGADCYVVRLAHGAVPAVTTLQDMAARNVLVARAKMKGLWGNGIRLEVDYNTPNPGETFNLRLSLEEGGRVVRQEQFTNLSMDVTAARYAPNFVTQRSDLIELELDSAGLGDPSISSSDYNSLSFAGFSQGRRPLGTNLTAVLSTLRGLIDPTSPIVPRFAFDISVDNSGPVTVRLRGMPLGDSDYDDLPALADAIGRRINDELARLVPAPRVTVGFDQVTATSSSPLNDQHLLRITAVTTGGRNVNVRVRRAANNDIAAALMLGPDDGGVEFARFSNYRPMPTSSTFRIIADNSADLSLLDGIAALRNPALTEITLDGVDVPLSDATSSPSGGWFQDNLPGTSANGNNDGVRQKLRSVAAAINNHPTSRYRAEVHGYYLVLLAKDGPINQTPEVVINTVAGRGRTAFANALKPNVRQYTLDGGDNGEAPEFADYVGNPTDQSGFHALDTVDLFNLMILPADAGMNDSDRQQLWGPASIYCQSRRAFLLVDAPDSWTSTDRKAAIVQNSTEVNSLRSTVVKDYSAVFYPKIRINDNGTIRSVSPAGAIAGLMARIDASRGVWKATAGTEASLRNVVGLDVKLTDRENGVLNKLGANCLRQFPTGFVSWGARTLDGSDDLTSEWKYVPVRRLALFLEESLYRGTQWVVFEPNDEPLWAQIRLNVGAFMNTLFRQGAFQGRTPREAYLVKCDAETTTQNDINLGIVNIVVGFAPLKPAEFVIITIQQLAGQVQV